MQALPPPRIRPSLRTLWLALCLALAWGPAAVSTAPEVPAAEAADTAAGTTPPAADPAGRGAAPLPPPHTTEHTLARGEEAIAFTATAGALLLHDARDRPEAEIAYVAYVRQDEDPAARPVTFAVNGGPGAASAYLHVGAIGPWIVPLDGERIAPSRDAGLIENPDTWLDITDLVFVDPIGTGFSRLLEAGERVRGRYLSIDGDADALAAFIARWLIENDRTASPVHLVGESYGGFRAPLVAERLQREHGVAPRGLALVSPVLDFGWWQQPAHAPLPHVSLLPSLVAAGLKARGEFSTDRLAEAEAYAAGDYVVDLLRGHGDPAARARVVERVAALTGLPEATVERYAGRVDAHGFVRELLRDTERIVSVYDTTVFADDAAPEQPLARNPEPVLDGMTAPLTRAMITLYRERLGWLPERRYHLLNRSINRAWNWGGGRSAPEAVGPLRRAMALDPALRVLVVHGYTDLITPYFTSTLILRQVAGPDAENLRQATYPGGHMFYTRPDSRAAFRSDARWLFDEDAATDAAPGEG